MKRYDASCGFSDHRSHRMKQSCPFINKTPTDVIVTVIASELFGRRPRTSQQVNLAGWSNLPGQLYGCDFDILSIEFYLMLSE